MISDLGTQKEIPLISGFGVAVGYVGTLVGLTVYPFIGDSGYHHAFIPTAMMFLIFSLPLFLLVKEEPVLQDQKKSSFISGYKEIYQTFKDIRTHRAAFLFMIAYFFLNDAIATAITMMAIYCRFFIRGVYSSLSCLDSRKHCRFISLWIYCEVRWHEKKHYGGRPCSSDRSGICSVCFQSAHVLDSWKFIWGSPWCNVGHIENLYS
jgi:MFS family permease